MTRVLLIEDNPDDADLLRLTLEGQPGHDFELQCSETLSNALRLLDAGGFGLVLLDLSLPDSHGPDTFRRVHAHAPSLPMVVLTGLDDQEVAVQAVHEGAQDYLVKGDLDGRLLVRAMRYAVERQQAHDELRRAKEAAEAASHAKSEFLANMSHEIRTPLNTIIGLTEFVLGEDLPLETRNSLQLALWSAETLLSLLNDILDISQIEAGRMDLKDRPFALRPAVEEILRAMTAQARKKHLELSCHMADDVRDHLVGDAGRLRQVLINLVGNALKFTDQGSVTLSVRAAPSADSEDSTLHFQVRDTGIGIPKHKQEAIFKTFAQADASSTRSYGGTGLGLAIASKLVTMMGGRI